METNWPLQELKSALMDAIDVETLYRMQGEPPDTDLWRYTEKANDAANARFEKALNALIDARVEAKLAERATGISRQSAEQMAADVAKQIDLAARR